MMLTQTGTRAGTRTGTRTTGAGADAAARAESMRRYLAVVRSLDALEKQHPELSAPLRLTLLRAQHAHERHALGEQELCRIIDQTSDAVAVALGTG